MATAARPPGQHLVRGEDAGLEGSGGARRLSWSARCRNLPMLAGHDPRRSYPGTPIQPSTLPRAVCHKGFWLCGSYGNATVNRRQDEPQGTRQITGI